ncbi:MAG: 3-dehydroquinate synthase [Casimicrobiaceae bacterium]
MPTLNVALAERSYPIHIGEGILARAGELLAPSPPARAIVVTNPVVAAHHLVPLEAALSRAGVRCDAVLVPDGEAHKDWTTLYDIHTRLLELGAERSTLLVALGGGVIGDLAGFAAATYQRGMPLLQVPTTLLAQVDSSVGGKTAVNHPLGKNMIGAFHQPLAVLVDTATLATLPEREYVAGVAEIIKYGAACDASLFSWLEANIAPLLARAQGAIEYAVAESCRIKARVVAADEREAGARALLNFGHTFGHAIEAAAGYGTWLHGEAVAAGMVLATRLSVRIAGLPQEDAGRIVRLIDCAGLPVQPPSLPLERWIELMSLDKKVRSGTLRFILLRALGDAVARSDASSVDLRAAICG